MRFILVFLFLPLLALCSPEPFGEVKFVHGSVEGKDGALQVGSPVFLGETIKAGKKSTARILLRQGIALAVGAETSIVLAEEKNGVALLNLLKGAVLSNVKPAVTPKYEVRSRGVSMGVRGTTFFVSQEQKRTLLCVCNGSVQAKWKSGSELITTKHHDHPVYLIRGGSKKLEPASVNNELHSDEEIAELAKLIL